jgi:hypothetical protein
MEFFDNNSMGSEEIREGTRVTEEFFGAIIAAGLGACFIRF